MTNVDLRAQIKTALSTAGAFCGECGFEPGGPGCPDCQRVWDGYADALLPVVQADRETRRSEVLREIITRLGSRATLYGSSQTVNEVMRDLEHLAGQAGKDTHPGESTQPGGPFERVTVILTAASSAALRRAAEITRDSRTDTINRAVQSYALMAGEVRDGGQVVLTRGEPGPDAAASAGRPASQPPLKGLVRQIRATANAEFATGHGRAVRDFARDLEGWIPEDFESEAFDRADWVYCSHRACPNGEYRAKATERGWRQGPMDAWLCDQHAPGGEQ